jgi:DNA-binding NtrC family response regulator
MDFLVIDDDKTFRDATCLLIEDEGHHAESAATGEIGLQTLKDDEFDAVLLDLNLGDENGLDVLQQLVKSTPDLPVVMFTAQGNVASAVEAMRRGGVDETNFDKQVREIRRAGYPGSLDCLVIPALSASGVSLDPRQIEGIVFR